MAAEWGADMANELFGQDLFRTQRGLERARGAARKKLIEPLVGAQQSEDPVEFLRSFAGAAGLPSIQQQTTEALAANDPQVREAGAGLLGALQEVTPQGQQRAFDAEIQARFDQQGANIKSVQEEVIRTEEAIQAGIDTNSQRLQWQQDQQNAQRQGFAGSFNSLGERATAITQVASNVDGYNAANDILGEMARTGQGNWTIPSEARGRLKMKRLPMFLALKEMLDTGTLQKTDIEWLDGITRDPTKWTNAFELMTDEQRGELLGFLELTHNLNQRNARIYRGLAEQEPENFQLNPRFDGGVSQLPQGFVPLQLP